MANAYQYDVQGRLTNVLSGGNSIAGYGFDGVGNLQSIRYGNGVTNLYQYDPMNRLTNLLWRSAGTNLASFGYTLGPTGNRTTLVETNGGAIRGYSWQYDSLYRLTQETLTGGSSGTLSYGYDAVGNRTNRTSTLTVIGNQLFTYTTNDWLASDGNTTNSGTIPYQYDAMDRLTNVNSGQVLIAYDGDGNRVRKTTSTGTTYFLVDDRNPSGYVQVLEEWTAVSGTTNLGKVYNYGTDLISQRQATGTLTTNYFVFDGHGSTRILVDIGGNVANAFAYDAYGALISSNGTPQTAYLYCGQQFDSDLGMYYQRARYMNQDTGRFWTMDTDERDQEEPKSLHKYAYCEGSPVDHTDPSGQDFARYDVAIGIAFSVDLVLESPLLQQALRPITKLIGSLSAKDVAGFIYNETQSLSGSQIRQARINVAHVIRNGDGAESSGTIKKRPKTAAPKVCSPDPDILQKCQEAVNVCDQDINKGTDSTKGSIHFNLRPNSSQSPFQ